MDPHGEIEAVDWKAICGRRIEDLLFRERRIRSLDPLSQSTDLLQTKFLRTKIILALRLCDAIRRKNVFNFLSVLEQQYCMERLDISSIVDQVSCAGNTLLHLAANSGSQVILHLMADHFPRLILKRNIKGDTALHVVARTQNAVSIKIILDSYAKHSADKFYKVEEEVLWRIRNEYGNTALHEAVMASNVEGTELLFSADKMVTHKMEKESKSPLYLAVEARNTLILNLLLEAPFHDTEEHEGNSPLHAALLRRKSDILKELVWKRPNLIHPRDQKGGNPLHFAASVGYIEDVQMLPKANPLISLEWNTKGHLPIHDACREGHVNVVNEIVQQPWFEPVESLNHKGQNVLHIAAKSRKDEVVKYILHEM